MMESKAKQIHSKIVNKQTDDIPQHTLATLKYAAEELLLFHTDLSDDMLRLLHEVLSLKVPLMEWDTEGCFIADNKISLTLMAIKMGTTTHRVAKEARLRGFRVLRDTNRKMVATKTHTYIEV